LPLPDPSDPREEAAAMTVLAESRVDGVILRAAPALASGVLFLKTSTRRGPAKLVALIVGTRLSCSTL
jgi:hypothetical protein